MNRKKFLTSAVCFIVLVGFGMLSVFFIGSWSTNPKSAKFLEIDMAEIESGIPKHFEWEGQHFVVYRPSENDKEYLVSLNERTPGPKYKLEKMPDYFVYLPISTHLGCGLRIKKDDDYFPELKGWIDPCHMGFWDFSGRNFPGVHMPNEKGLPNLRSPVGYREVAANVIRFGERRI